MKIGNLSGSQVWSTSSRSLTNIGSGALAPTSAVASSLAASTAIDLRPSAGTLGQATAAVLTGAGATAAALITLFDGTTAKTMASTAAAATSPAAFHTTNTASVGLRLFNSDAAQAASYEVASWVFTI